MSNQSNFYAVAIYLSRSGRSLLILANFGFLFSLLCGKILQKIFFGPLQAREVERLYDQTWMFVTESLLAFTIFRDEFDIPFLLMFGFLLFVKCFHWLMADRIESMEQVQYPGPKFTWHLRMNCLFSLLFLVDVVMFAYSVESTLINGVGGMVLFATEYAILVASTLNAISRYFLNIFEYRRATRRGGENAAPWESKSMYVFYIELVTDFLKLTTYLTFFMIILTFYGLPLNIIRDVYLTARSFITRLRALIRYHNATRDMDRRYPNATEEELTAMSDRTCIICREELTLQGQANGDAAGPREERTQQEDGPNMTPKKLPCGHVFHFQCLRSWLERQQSCPTCRRTVLETNTNQTNTQQNQNRPQGGQAQPNARQPGLGGVAPQPGLQPQAQGWLQRFFGIPPPQPPAAQIPAMPPHQWWVNPPPPLVQPGQPGQPGQQVPTPVAQQVPQPQAPQPVPGPAGGYYPYPVPYLYPPHGAYPYPPLYNPYQPPPPLTMNVPLNPPPHLRGFQGPGGQIHPWPITPGQADQAQAGTSGGTGTAPAQQTRVAPTQPGSSNSATSTSANQLPRTESQEPTSDGSAATSNVSSEQSQPIPRAETGPSPRSAAAEAALRRLGGSQAASIPTPTQTQTTTSAISPPAPTPTPGQQQSTSAGQSNAPTPTVTSPAPAGASTSQSQTTGAASPPAQHGRYNLPNLIPAPDLSARPIAPLGYGYPFPQAIPPQYRFPPPPSSATVRAQMNFPAGATGPLAQSAQHQQQLRQRQQQYQHSPLANVPPPPPYQQPTPLAELPPTLTDEQLGRLDRLTREAIDERLRVLEGVSGAVWRCVEDLTRMRSVLPRSAPTPSASRSSSQPATDQAPSTDNVASSSTGISEPIVQSSSSQPPITQIPSADTANGVQTLDTDGITISSDLDAPIPRQVSLTPPVEASLSGSVDEGSPAENDVADGSN
ncbi:hypothetical protein QCA50_011717 [Cerrena zonata]|uniref:RING-type E3 ubiquitin transferase n=1 Tax=Cerrena zonata TaxID=2478898 RepID=A0AAW0G5S5_9APHY